MEKDYPIGPDLFDTPIRKTKVRNGIHAYKYRNGTININGKKFLLYSMTEAIRIWRKQNPVTGYDRWVQSLKKKKIKK
jgi:hypothetical protein